MSARVLPITVFVSVTEVATALGCSESTAYRHLRAAARRVAGTRGLLRVPVAAWERYAMEVAHRSRSRRSVRYTLDDDVIDWVQSQAEARGVSQSQVVQESLQHADALSRGVGTA